MAEQEQTEQDVVWMNTIDGGVWGCSVIRTAPYQGRLSVWNAETHDIILDEQIGLAFDAVFGPDVGDLTEWQDKIIAAIDAQNQSGETK